MIWVAGSNVAECSPITTNYVWQAREQGAKVIVQDPRITPVARTCDLYLPVKPGRDAALFAGVLQIMIERDWLDHAFIRDYTVGFDQVAEYCREWTLARDLENPELWVETYHSPTWHEYVRHNLRATHSDAVVGDTLFAAIAAAHCGSKAFPDLEGLAFDFVYDDATDTLFGMDVVWHRR